jgi:hypothetical protein
MIATCPIKTNNQKAKLGKKEARSTREREGDMAGERERGGGAPEKEGGAARGRFGDDGRRLFWFSISFVLQFFLYIGFDLGMVTCGGL